MSQRVLVTGSRDWTDEEIIWDALLEYLPSRGSLMDTVILVHGDCPTGADHLASLLWTANGGIEEPHPARWKEFGRSAGFRRNKFMVDLGADVCLAFMMPCSDTRCPRTGQHGSHGTEQTARMAEGAGIPVRLFRV